MRRFTTLVFVVLLVGAAATLPAQDTTQDPALFAVGSLGASNLYTSYFLLGTLADGYATAAYTA